MSNKNGKQEWADWFSTYGILTAERILDRYNIRIAQNELIKSLKDPTSIYSQLLHVPLKNIFNGIIIEQARDYQTYAQKLFIDYLLSGQDTKENTEPGATVREDIESHRLKLIEINDEFEAIEREHQALIADSQSALIELTRNFNALLTCIKDDSRAIEKALSMFIERAEMVNINARSYRSAYYNHILRVTELLRLLPDYKPDPEQDAENRSLLAFDALIGEE